MEHKYRVFAVGREFLVVAAVQPGSPGRLSGPPEDCYPADPPEIEVDSIEMKLGTRRRVIQWDALNDKAQDAILDDIMEQWSDAAASYRQEYAERRNDAHMDR